jgi:thiamine-phosphate diphosphorylase
MAPVAEPRSGLELFAVTPGRGDRAELEAALPRIAARGATRLLLREKQLDPAARRALAESLLPACRRHRLALWISEEVELAMSIGAAGVQLSERSPSPRIVRARLPAGFGLGVSLHDPATREEAELAACDHAFLGPVFPTPGKRGAGALGIARFVEIAATLPLPVFAIGGVGEGELAALAAAGVRRAAAIRLFFA